MSKLELVWPEPSEVRAEWTGWEWACPEYPQIAEQLNFLADRWADDNGSGYFPDRPGAMALALGEKLGAQVVDSRPAQVYEPGTIY